MSKQPLAGVIEGQVLASDAELECDVCIVGSGAGGAVTAAILQKAGLKVIVLEEGGYFTNDRFRMREAEATRDLYQERATRATKDGSVAVLQGRAVGGTTVINWTTSYRTPKRVLNLWAEKYKVDGFSSGDLKLHFEAVEERLHVAPWPLEKANRNNRLLYDGCQALGYETHMLRRNVKGCADLGTCGLGCPIDAKQSMLVSYLPDAMHAGATVISRCRVDRLRIRAGTVTHLEGTLLDASGRVPTGVKLTVAAKHFILSAGAIGSPAILMRSGVEDPHKLLGKRTFLHPVVVTAAEFSEPVMGWQGAPQSVASKQFYDRGADLSILLEAVPVFPALFAASAPGIGARHRGAMDLFPNTAIHLALLGDGFHDDVPGGQVELRGDGTPVLDYELPDRVWETFREAHKILARVQLAAGARVVRSLHDPAVEIRSLGDLRKLDDAPFKAGRLLSFSAHVMGGAPMSDDPALGVVRSEDLRHHGVRNLHVIDGSVFPTSLGVNPQETIYGIAHLAATRLGEMWT